MSFHSYCKIHGDGIVYESTSKNVLGCDNQVKSLVNKSFFTCYHSALPFVMHIPVAGEDSSWAHGFVAADGLFEGSFHLAGVRYHVEPASHYSHIALDGKLFNTIIYSEMDVDHDYKLAEPLVGYKWVQHCIVTVSRID